MYAYRKRAFLAPVSTGFTSYIFAEAESSDNGEYKQGNYILQIADCRRVIQLEFYLGTPRHRQQSLKKIKLVQTLTDFQTALEKESKLIDEFNSAKKTD